MIKNKIPDFLILPWRQNNTYHLAAEDGSRVGFYIEYVNERTGDLGVEIEITGVRDLILVWGEKVRFREREIVCRYLAVRDFKGRWTKVRVKKCYPVRTIREVFGRTMNVKLYFELATKGELEISYPIGI